MSTPTPGAAPQMAAETPLERIGPEICTSDAQLAIARICDSHPETERLFDALVARYNSHAYLLAALEKAEDWITNESQCATTKQRHNGRMILIQARAALAKAKAGAQ